VTASLWRAHYLVRSAVQGLRQSPVTSAVAVGTIAISLVMVGVFALVLKQMSGLLERVGEDLTVTAYLDEGLAPAARSELAARAATVEGVARVEVVTPAEALRRFEAASDGRAGLLEGLEENPLPASLEIALAPGRRTEAGIRVVVEALTGLPGIAEVGHGGEWVETYRRVLSGVRAVAVALGGVLVLAALLIVANTIRLAVYARRDELEILALVGASRAFIGTPFLLEGVLEGTAAALLALVVLFLAFQVAAGLGLGLELVLGYGEPAFFAPGEMLALLGAGAGLGLLGSAAALVSAWSQR